MKKIKILTSLVGLTGLSMGLVPTITSCSCNKTTSNVELDESVTKQGVTVKSSNIQKDKESTIELNLPSGKSISAITLEIGNTTLSKSDVTIDNAKITIPAAKMSVAKVTIKSITLSSEPTEVLTATLDLTALTTAGITTNLPTTVKSDSASLTFNATATAAKSGKFRFKYEASAEKGTKVETVSVDLSTTTKEGISANLKDIFDVMKDAGQTSGTVYVSFVTVTPGTKDNFFEKLDKWVTTDSTSFAKYHKQYSKDQITLKVGGEIKTVSKLRYYRDDMGKLDYMNDEDTYRMCDAYYGQTDMSCPIALEGYTSAILRGLLKEAGTGITYEVDDDHIYYEGNVTTPQTESTCYKLGFNKYGYVTHYSVYMEGALEEYQVSYAEAGPTISSKSINTDKSSYTLPNIINLVCDYGNEINSSNLTLTLEVSSIEKDKNVTFSLLKDGTAINTVDYTTIDPATSDHETITFTFTQAQYNALAETGTYTYSIVEKA